MTNSFKIFVYLNVNDFKVKSPNECFSVQPETVIIPIVCSIIIFPIVVLATICLLKHYNERARAKDRFRSEEISFEKNFLQESFRMKFFLLENM